MAYATGEGTRWQEFDNFFAANHKVYGLSDLIGLRNLQQEYVTLTWTKASLDLQGFVAFHALALANGAAGWRNAGGQVTLLPQDIASSDRFLGGSCDVAVRYTPSSNLFVELGYSLFEPGAGARRYGRDRAIHFLYLWTETKLP